MDTGPSHEQLIQSLTDEYRELFARSRQGVYVYLDDVHKVCNEKFAALLGYPSPKEWAAVKANFPDAFVADDSQGVLVTAYRKAIEDCIGSNIRVNWKKKSGGTVEASVILVPIVHHGHLLALHFVTERG